MALDIVVQAYQACPPRHAPAVALAHIPTIARLLAIFIGTWMGGKPIFQELLAHADGPAIPDALVIIALGNGFIVTGMLVGWIPRGTHRPPTAAFGFLPAHSGHSDLLRHHPLVQPGRQNIR